MIPEPIPLGLTFLLAIVLATAVALFLNVPRGGNVDSVVPATSWQLLRPGLAKAGAHLLLRFLVRKTFCYEIWRPNHAKEEEQQPRIGANTEFE